LERCVLQVLLVEDNPGDARLIEWQLCRPGSRDFVIARAERLAQAMLLLGAGSYDAILLDLSLPDSAGLDTVRRTRHAAGKTPIVVMTGLDDEETALAALRSGAQDYLVKGKFESSDLTRALRHAIERERVEQALRQVKDALEAIITASPAAVLTLDAQGMVRTWNRSAEMIFGWRPDEVLGGSVPFVPAEKQSEFDGLLSRALAGESLVNLEVRRQRKDGTPVDVSLSTAPLRGPDDTVLGVVAVITDISARKAAETALSNKSAELARNNEELRRLNEFKNQVLGMAAHDLRNPLSVILACSEFLLSPESGTLEPARRTDFLSRIERNSTLMMNLINDLLDLTQIESGQLRLSPRPLAVAELVERNVSVNRMLADARSIELGLTVPKDLPEVMADPARIEQVLNNLIGNALKFSGSGSRVEVSAARENGAVVVTVRDAGPGIPAEELGRLFKPFSRTSVRPAAGEKSTGLGLAIARKIVEGHGGRIWAESEVGRGSTFRFSLPVSAA
jgi:PAS domain S-box-containing protein